MVYEIREGREEDRESVVQVLTRALGSLETFQEGWVDAWRRYWNRPENEDWAYVATHNGRVVTNLSFFKNDGFNEIRGGGIPFGGVWAVGTESEYRRKGLLTRIFNQVFPVMKKKGMVLSILDPSPYQGAQIAYEKNGFAVAEHGVKHEFSPNALRPIEGDPGLTVRELEDLDACMVISNLEMSMSRFGSRVFSWSTMFAQEIRQGNFFIFESGSEPVGCVKLSFQKTKEPFTLDVSRCYFTSCAVLPSIIKFINQKAKGIARVEWKCEPQIPVKYFFHNIHQLKTQNIGTMMMRVVDFVGYCQSIQVPEQAENPLILQLTDTQCPWNEGIFRLQPQDGSLNVERIMESRSVEVSLDPYQLSQVICGLIPPLKLKMLGMITCSYETVERLEAIFPVDSFYSYPRF